MSLHAPSSTTELPPLPTAETIAGGLLRGGKNPIFLPKEQKYRLYVAVEECIRQGYDTNAVLTALGMSRAGYFGHIWFTPEKAAEFASVLNAVAETKVGQGEEQPHKKPKGGLSAEEKIDKITEVSRLRYVEGHNFDEACRIVGIRQDSFYRWTGQRERLLRQIRRRKNKLSGGDRMHTRIGKGRRGETEELDDATRAKRAQMVNVIHRKVRDGAPLARVLREKGVKSTEYHRWAREAEIEIKPREKVIDLWHAYRNASEGQEKEDARERLIMHFRPTVEHIAHRYAAMVRDAGTFQVDEGMLISVGFFEGVQQHIDLFDENRGIAISTYFHQKIAQRILDEMRVQDWVPRTERAKERTKRNLADDFMRATNRPPRNDEELLEFALASGEAALLQNPLPRLTSVDVVLKRSKTKHHDADGKEQTLVDWIESEDTNKQNHHREQVSHLTDDVLHKCRENERRILVEYYLHEKTMKEIGAEMGLSESRISQLHSDTVSYLQHILANDPSMPILHNVGQKETA